MNMTETNGDVNSRTKKKTIIVIAILIVALSVALCWGMLQTSFNAHLEDEAESREQTIKELQQKVDKLEDQLMKNAEGENEVLDLGKYDATKIIDPSTDNGLIGDHVRGKIDSKVVVVEYADMSCPGCASMMPYLNNIYKKYSDKVAFVFRHYPLKDHQNSRPVSAAVESAGIQGYYWEMLEATFANRTDWLYSTNLENEMVKIFKKVAPRGDVEKFRKGLSSTKIEKKINFDHDLGQNVSKVSATPTIFVNGKLIDISGENVTFDSFSNDIMKEIESELAK